MTLILQLDIAGNPSNWITPHEAIRMVACGRAITGLGDTDMVYRGGWNRLTGIRSEITVNTILLTRKRVDTHRQRSSYIPPVSNRLLFERDAHTCMYCGTTKGLTQLTRDHVIPVSRGGRDTWSNVVAACRHCNQAKGNQLPEEWGHALIAVPYVPNYAEYLYLLNQRRIIADQRAFLTARFPRNSRLM